MPRDMCEVSASPVGRQCSRERMSPHTNHLVPLRKRCSADTESGGDRPRLLVAVQHPRMVEGFHRSVHGMCQVGLWIAAGACAGRALSGGACSSLGRRRCERHAPAAPLHSVRKGQGDDRVGACGTSAGPRRGQRRDMRADTVECPEHPSSPYGPPRPKLHSPKPGCMCVICGRHRTLQQKSTRPCSRSAHTRSWIAHDAKAALNLDSHLNGEPVNKNQTIGQALSKRLKGGRAARPEARSSAGTRCRRRRISACHRTFIRLHRRRHVWSRPPSPAWGGTIPRPLDALPLRPARGSLAALCSPNTAEASVRPRPLTPCERRLRTRLVGTAISGSHAKSPTTCSDYTHTPQQVTSTIVFSKSPAHPPASPTLGASRRPPASSPLAHYCACARGHPHRRGRIRPPESAQAPKPEPEKRLREPCAPMFWLTHRPAAAHGIAGTYGVVAPHVRR